MSEDGQILYCSGCGTGVRVYHGEWIDPDLYCCKECRSAGNGLYPPTLPLPGMREDTPEYDPTMAAIPF
jgi:hypothetical protein